MTPERLAEIERLVDGYPNGDEQDWLEAALMAICDLLTALRKAQADKDVVMDQGEHIARERDALQRRVEVLEVALVEILDDAGEYGDPGEFKDIRRRAKAALGKPA